MSNVACSEYHSSTGDADDEGIDVDGTPLSPLQRIASGLSLLRGNGLDALRSPNDSLQRAQQQMHDGVARSPKSSSTERVHHYKSTDTAAAVGAKAVVVRRTLELSPSLASRQDMAVLLLTGGGTQEGHTLSIPATASHSNDPTSRLLDAASVFLRRGLLTTPNAAHLPANTPVVAVPNRHRPHYPTMAELVCSRCDECCSTTSSFCHSCGGSILVMLIQGARGGAPYVYA